MLWAKITIQSDNLCDVIGCHVTKVMSLKSRLQPIQPSQLHPPTHTFLALYTAALEGY